MLPEPLVFSLLSHGGTSLKIGIMGGTFDPIHLAHLYIAEEARQAVPLDKVLFIPAAQPPHKSDPFITPPEQRLEMVRLATKGNPCFEVSSMEIEMTGKSYSVRTVERLKQHYGNEVELYFITGVDAFAEIATWFEVERLLTLCNFVVTSRPRFPFRQLETVPYIQPESLPLLGEMDSGRSVATAVLRSGKRVVLLNTLPLDISATDLRNRIRSGKSVRYLLPEVVESYIMMHSLYSSNQASITT